MAEEEKARDVTRRDLAEALERANALIESQGKAIAELQANALSAKAERELAEARRTLGEASRTTAKPPVGS